MKPQTIAILLSSALVMSATTTATMAQTRDLYERNNEFNSCTAGNVDPRCYTAQYRDPYERNNEFNSCTPGNMDPRCYSASGGGRYDPDRDYLFYYDDEDE